jgi:hypothetical protein
VRRALLGVLIARLMLAIARYASRFPLRPRSHVDSTLLIGVSLGWCHPCCSPSFRLPPATRGGGPRPVERQRPHHDGHESPLRCSRSRRSRPLFVLLAGVRLLTTLIALQQT